MYEHYICCSGSPAHPRGTKGHCCSCGAIDLHGNRLYLERHGEEAKRTLYVAVCPQCQERKEFPSDAPKESFCQKCSLWVKVEALSWDGQDFVHLLPVFPRRTRR